MLRFENKHKGRLGKFGNKHNWRIGSFMEIVMELAFHSTICTNGMTSNALCESSGEPGCQIGANCRVER